MSRLFSAGASIAALAIGSGVQAAPGPNEILIFEDNFNNFNLSLWKHEITLSGEGNWEFEIYINNRSTSFVRNGTLHIKPGLYNNTLGSTAALNSAEVDLWGGDAATSCTNNGFYGCDRTGGAGGNILNPIQSARIRTAETFAFTYGRVEVVAKLPKGDWLWPAIWMMPTNAQYGGWPASGEVDIVESKGNARGYPGGGCEAFSTTLHWGPYWPEDAYLQTHSQYTVPSGDLSQDFHTYGFWWNSTHMYSYIDNDTVAGRVLDTPITQPFWSMGGWANNTSIDNPWEGQGDNAPFDQRFYLIINLAAGGTNGYFPDGNNDGKPWSNTSPNAINEFWAAVDTWYPTWTQDFEVDSVKVWQTPGSGGDYAFRPML